MSGGFWVVAVPVLVWVGVLAYLIMLDRKVSVLETRAEVDDR